LKVIDRDKYGIWCEEMIQKGKNKGGQKKSANQKQTVQKWKVNARSRARTKSMSDEEESYLENGINLPIEEGSEASNEDVSDDNVAGVLISVGVQTAIRLNEACEESPATCEI
jgi:hypothetical protein